MIQVQEDKILGLVNEIRKNARKARIAVNVPMSEHTTFRCGGNAALFVQPSDEIDLVMLLQVLNRTRTPWYVTGNGSNLLVSDKGYDGVIINTMSDAGRAMAVEFYRTVEGWSVNAAAGFPLAKLSRMAMERSLSGLEFASGIPGSVGGAVVMNAGAYGGEISQVIREAIVHDSEGKGYVLNKDALKLGYRDSIFKHEKYVCLNVTFDLKEGDRNEISGLMDEMNEKRREKQPLEYPSAGSTFKRPRGHFAGKLIMEAGLAGYSIGGAQVSEKHCGFIINRGGATSSDVKKLMDHVTRVVYENSGVMLEREVCLIGDFE